MSAYGLPQIKYGQNNRVSGLFFLWLMIFKLISVWLPCKQVCKGSPTGAQTGFNLFLKSYAEGWESVILFAVCVPQLWDLLPVWIYMMFNLPNMDKVIKTLQRLYVSIKIIKHFGCSWAVKGNARWVVGDRHSSAWLNDTLYHSTYFFNALPSTLVSGECCI